MTPEELKLYETLSQDEKNLITRIHDVNMADVETIYLDDDCEPEEDGKLYTTIIVQMSIGDDMVCIRNYDLDLYKHCRSFFVDLENQCIQVWFSRLCEDMITQGFYMPEQEVLEKMGVNSNSPLDEIAKRYNEYVINE